MKVKSGLDPSFRSEALREGSCQHQPALPYICPGTVGRLFVVSVETLGINPIEMTHATGKIAVRSMDQQTGSNPAAPTKIFHKITNSYLSILLQFALVNNWFVGHKSFFPRKLENNLRKVLFTPLGEDGNIHFVGGQVDFTVNFMLFGVKYYRVILLFLVVPQETRLIPAKALSATLRERLPAPLLRGAKGKQVQTPELSIVGIFPAHQLNIV